MTNLEKKIAKIYLDELLSVNNTVTTLELKNELRNKFPQAKWFQSDISDFLNSLYEEGELSYVDNGIFRVYSRVLKQTTDTMQPINQKIEKVGITKLAEIVKSNAGKFLTIVHKKHNSSEINLMNVQILKKSDVLGCIHCKEQKQEKRFYPSDLLEVRVGGKIYKLK